MSSVKNFQNSFSQLAWAQHSLHRSFSRTQLFLRRQLWIWPIVAILVLAVIGLFVRNAVELTMRQNLQSELQTILNLEVSMLNNWMKTQEVNALSLANDRQVRALAIQLVDEQSAPIPATTRSDTIQLLVSELAPGMSHHDYLGFALMDKSRTILAATYTEVIGKIQTPVYDDLLRRVFQGETIVTPPFASEVPMEDRVGKRRTGVPVMFACAPVRDDNFQVVAALALRIDPEADFSAILQLGRLGQSGETYAFNREGTFISRSRFEEELVLLGLLPDQADATPILSLQVRDPEGNLMEGHRPHVRRGKLPFTQMAVEAMGGRSGVNVVGYRDYRGIPVVGAWEWLPDYQMGVTTEIDVSEAFRPLYILRRTVWGMYLLLGIASLVIFIFTILVARANRAAQEAAIEAKQLGQYQLDEKLGSGAMGIVYRGHHALLRRPTAIKLLGADRTNEESIARFEREVQLTCQLNHPNTVMIYDFGRTPENVFYYAMEFLDGIDLQRLVEQYGPQPEGRVMRILAQVCGSLYEAHLAGLVHRDIKPANIMLNRRGAEPDIVKVLDFGLAKAVDHDKQAGLTTTSSLTGTPLYLSPEAIQTPDRLDPRSDLYAVGAVGYFLLTGQPVFSATSLVELCRLHVEAAPIPPSQRLGKAVSPELEQVIMSCLEKSPARRPQTARELAIRLEKSPLWLSWTIENAEGWWQRHEQRAAQAPNTGPRTESPAHERTLITPLTED